jgi:hypothetical protein
VAARDAARALALGRVAIGAGMVAAPTLSGLGWLGRDAERPTARALTRALGVRDLILGALTLHTLDHPQVGPRWVATCAAADAVDALAFARERPALTRAGGPAVIALAAGAAAGGFAVAAKLRSAGPGGPAANLGPVAPGA